MNSSIFNMSATPEVADALTAAFERGLCPYIDDDFDPETALRFWRDSDGRLYATAPNIVEPAATLVSLELERGAGYRAID